MARLIPSPSLGPIPRVLRIPRAPGTAAPEDAQRHQAPAVSAAEHEAKLAAAAARAAEAEARTEAAETALEVLRSELEREREAARQSGLEEGHAEGVERASVEQREVLERVRACLDALARRVGERLEQEEDAIGEAVFASLRKLLVPVLTTREGVAAMVRAVCEQLRERETLVVRLAPGDHALLADEPGPLRAARGPRAAAVRSRGRARRLHRRVVRRQPRRTPRGAAREAARRAAARARSRDGGLA